LALGVILLGVVGLVDDALELRTAWRILTQLGAVVVVMLSGDLQIQQLGNLAGFDPIGLWIFAPVFTLLCMLLMINAVNMLDGIDGLAGGVSFVTLAGFSVMLWLDGATGWQPPILLALSVLGFLAFNLRGPWRRSASVFMGDAGSTVLGFVLAWLAVYTTQSEDASVYPIAVAWLLILPAADALSLFFRRIADGRNPMTADRWHLHHVLIRAGLSTTTSVYTLIGIQCIFVVIGITGWYVGLPEWLMFWPLAIAFAAYQLLMWRASFVLKFLRRRLRTAS
jgi:UDP-GlcNAc:undecaprenyl-phosphate GlcNAc-1-phosphate transferase